MERVEQYAKALGDGLTAALPRWVVESVERLLVAWQGSVQPEQRAQAVAAAAEATATVIPEVLALLAMDIDEQRANPLAILRRAVAYPTAVLRAAGVPPVQRDADDEARFPDDVYGLTPARFADLDPALAEAGFAWGAAKAFEHRRRHSGSA